MLVRLVSHTPRPDDVVAMAALVCYSRKRISSVFSSGIPRKKREKLISGLLEEGHLSPFEHAAFSFSIEGVSRSCLCQLTRHRMASFSVRSQRYVSSTDAVCPFQEGTREREMFDVVFRKSKETYETLLREGTKKEDARSLLLEGSTTQLVMTANGRSLMNFFNLRLCLRAQGEIRRLAGEMLRLARDVAPLTFAGPFPDCGRCRKCVR